MNTKNTRGCTWHKRDKCWVAKIKVNGKTIHLGNFPDLESARSAFRIAERKRNLNIPITPKKRAKKYRKKE
jgi:hypothetical protein